MKHFSTALLALGIQLAALPAARAADTTCNNNTTISNSTVNGNLTVPTGAFCTLGGPTGFGVTVTGNVQVQTNASLLINNTIGGSTIDGNVSVGKGATLSSTSLGVQSSNSTIGGNIAARQCTNVNLSNINVGGNAQIEDCTGPNTGVGDSAAEIAGNFACNNNAICFAIFGDVKGNVQINDNANATVTGNTIGDNLQCQGNGNITDIDPATGISTPNTVGGHKTGQCAGF